MVQVTSRERRLSPQLKECIRTSDRYCLTGSDPVSVQSLGVSAVEVSCLCNLYSGLSV
jgi:hypothetical protein